MGNLGCDKRTGQCYECKRNVQGARCDRCKPGYYGLSASLDAGCETCSCAPGFSYSSDCDRVTGACSCKANFHGPRCNLIGDGFYCARIDHVVYEAEDAIETSNFSQAVERYDPDSGYFDHLDDLQDPEAAERRRRSWIRWTGIGYMRVFENSHLKFRLMHVHNTGLFDLVIRYEATENWDDIRIKVVKVGAENFRAKEKSNLVKSCADLRPNQKNDEQVSGRFNKCMKDI